jgi:histidinol-phosphate aminotransferase
MSRFLHKLFTEIVPYQPGERPAEGNYIKLNTNESPYPPAPGVIQAIHDRAGTLNLYNDPNCADFTAAAARYHALKPEEIFAGNGADEVLQYALLAFFGPGSQAVHSDITYPYYKGYFKSFGVNARALPLRDDFSVDAGKFASAPENAVLVNPNAPTGLSLPLREVEGIVAADSGRIVLVDEAYIDYGGESCLPLIRKYDNLIVVRTFSKSRNLAGGRIGYAAGCPALIADMNAIKAVLNPYNLDTLAQAGGVASFEDEMYFQDCLQKVISAREAFMTRVRAMGFRVLESKANFVFISHESIHAGDLYRELKSRRVLTRYYSQPRIDNWLRVSIGTPEDMEAVAGILSEILETYSRKMK